MRNAVIKICMSICLLSACADKPAAVQNQDVASESVPVISVKSFDAETESLLGVFGEDNRFFNLNKNDVYQKCTLRSYHLQDQHWTVTNEIEYTLDADVTLAIYKQKNSVSFYLVKGKDILSFADSISKKDVISQALYAEDSFENISFDSEYAIYAHVTGYHSLEMFDPKDFQSRVSYNEGIVLTVQFS